MFSKIINVVSSIDDVKSKIILDALGVLSHLTGNKKYSMFTLEDIKKSNELEKIIQTTSSINLIDKTFDASEEIKDLKNQDFHEKENMAMIRKLKLTEAIRRLNQLKAYQNSY